MIPYLFGKSESPLFGAYYPPRAGTDQDTGLVMCNPVGHEYLRTHRLLGQLANLLNREGYHVFRFDYFGTGDSAGQFANANLTQWIEDTGDAVLELCANSGLSNFAFFGVRLGANIAASCCSSNPNSKILLLWDPIINGGAYLDELSTMHKNMLSDGNRFVVPREQHRNQSDLIGYCYSERLRAEIRQVDLNGKKIASDNILILASQDTACAITEMMDQDGISSQTLLVDAKWKDRDFIEIPLQVPNLASTIISVLSH